MRREVPRAELAAVLRALDGLQEGRRPARDQRHHQAGVHAVGGRAFGGVQHAQAARRARAAVKQAAARAQFVVYDVDAAGDLGQRGLYGLGAAVILAVDQGNHVQGGQRIDVLGARVALLGVDPAKLHGHGGILPFFS